MFWITATAHGQQSTAVVYVVPARRVPGKEAARGGHWLADGVASQVSARERWPVVYGRYSVIDARLLHFRLP